MWVVPQLQHQFLLEGCNNNEKNSLHIEDNSNDWKNQVLFREGKRY